MIQSSYIFLYPTRYHPMRVFVADEAEFLRRTRAAAVARRRSQLLSFVLRRLLEDVSLASGDLNPGRYG